jgi:hypothetical protein
MNIRLAAATTALLILLVAASAHAGDRFVSTAGNDTANDCASSLAPCRTLEHGLAQAASGDTIKVAAGLYPEFVSIDVPITVTFSGGWTANFASRDPAVNVTTVENDQTDSFAIQGVQGQTFDVTLDGFSIVGGVHRASFGVAHSGGIDALAFGDASVTLAIVDSTLTRSSASDGGALGLGAGNTSTLHVSLTNCTLVSNFGPEAINVQSRQSASVSVSLTGCTLAKNATGGIFALAGETSTLTLAVTGTDVTHNKGVGITLVSAADATLHATVTDSVVEKNKGQSGSGGGISALCPTANGTGDLRLSLDRATITRNQARFDGGGGAIVSGSNAGCALDVTNSVIVRNKALQAGGGIAAETSDGGFGSGALTLALTDSTVTRNRSTAGGGGLNVATGPQSGADTLTATLTNTILFANKAPHSDTTGGRDLRMDQPAGTLIVNADHDDIGDRLTRAGTFNDLGGNISAVPLFVSVKDVHLTSASPCIDAGTCVGAPPADIDGDPRPSGAGCDIGADEFVP